MAEEHRRDGKDRSLINAVLHMHSNCMHSYSRVLCEKKCPKAEWEREKFVKQTHQSCTESTAALQLARRDS